VLKASGEGIDTPEERLMGRLSNTSGADPAGLREVSELQTLPTKLCKVTPGIPFAEIPRPLYPYTKDMVTTSNGSRMSAVSFHSRRPKLLQSSRGPDKPFRAASRMAKLMKLSPSIVSHLSGSAIKRLVSSLIST
jgi:hypothetical protein